MDEQRKAWTLRIDEAASLDDLDCVAAGLADVGESWKGPLMWKVSDRRRKLLVKEKHLSAGWAGAAAFANSYGLPAPDGRRLYAYRLNADAFERLQLELASKEPLVALAKGHVPGLFALWASEWFRRNYDGGGYSWNKLLKPLGLTGSGQTEQAELRKITSLGLGQWQRPVLRFESARGYLCSLAREGGFPTAAVAEGGGWARPVLEAIVAPLLGDFAAGEDRALAIAAAQRHRLPVSFRDDDFVQLCADLAVAIVDLRREATQPAAAAGLPILAWLDLNRPDWREVLPITTGDCTADSLIDGLMSVEAISGNSVGVERLLARGEDGVWREATRISLDGDIDSQTMRAISGDPGRLRVFASEELARHLPGELAMLEPPAIGSKLWTARSTRLVRGVQHIPFSASLMLELRVGARNLARVQLPGGKPRRGQLLVAQAESGDEDAPNLLKIVGSGSGQYRAQSLFLQMPRGWQVQTTVDEQAVLLGSGAGETDLWRVTGGAFAIDDSGDRYRIRCGQPADIATRIDLVGNRCPWAEVSGDVDLFNGAPHVGMRGMTGQLCLRQPGTRSWRPAPTPLPVGHYELGWRLDNILLDRRTIAVLPEGAEFTCHRSGPEVTYIVEGFGEVNIAPSADAPVIANAALHIWRPRAVHSRVYRFEATLTWPEGPPLGVGIQFPCEATIARWDGSVLPHGSTFTLEDLRDLVGIDGGRMELHAELREPRVGKCAQMVWEFDRELPLASIKGDLASLLLPGSIDAVVLLDMHDGINTNWYVKPFALTLRNEGGGFVSSEVKRPGFSGGSFI